MPDGTGFLPEAPANAAQVSRPVVDYLIRIGEVEKQSGLGRSTIYRRMAEGSFPLAVEVGGGQVRWRQSEVAGWVATREPGKMKGCTVDCP